MPQRTHSPQTSSPAAGDISEVVMNLEQMWASAAKANDVAKVAPLLAELFVDMDSDGSIHGRTDALERIKADKWEIYEISDVKVVPQGSLAIVTGAWRGKGTLANGKPTDAHERWLDTWHKNGKWQCIASASTSVS
jgi:ketosteroid isomerase-like protein